MIMKTKSPTRYKQASQQFNRTAAQRFIEWRTKHPVELPQRDTSPRRDNVMI